MFKKILIANRGEIALRIIWACRELGIKTVAVFSQADRDSLHVKFADQAICIGPPSPTESYLNIPAVISAAEISGADAIHPGYGFLAENPYFAEVCESCNIEFIGPSPELIGLMGNKSAAKETMARAGVPTVPGSKGVVKDEKEAEGIIEEIGLPVILKASAGGGGRGMRIVNSKEEFAGAFRTAAAEANAAFGVSDLYIERYLRKPRHIEIQIIADRHGNVVHLGERECSIQRRHQKLIEESPSPAVSAEMREEIASIAVKAAESIGYTNAGTVEFLLDEDGKFYFMEMNTRIQVEHAVTEMITGIDLVKTQIRVAAGHKLTFTQEDINFQGHAIECRVNAEDPVTFLPSPGKITGYNVPKGPGVRVDTAVYEGSWIPPNYDSLIAKVVVRGQDRKEAIARMDRSLEFMVVEDIKTTISLLLRVLRNKKFRKGDYSTRFLDDEIFNKR
ncbi:MAG TPA: acetyl-CoA carboxylase biotin carboxylase subunit [Acidobacteriota bacterium]|nr:acetyl-CoA carboxylase biotin carboxylase subunit [Acidobacteriota bacterium]